MLGNCIENVRKNVPLVHNITNYVTVNDVANVLLACGGSPIMSDEPEDVKEITSICGGLNINIGTLSKRSIEGMFAAGERANELGHATLLDPVGAGASTLRTNTAVELMEKIRFDVIRGNISEVKTLAQGSGTTKGVDADVTDAVTEENLEEGIAFAKAFAKKAGCIVAITGAIDLVSDADRCYVIRNGRPEMGKITGTGCQLSGMMTAFLTANPEQKLEAAAAAVCQWGWPERSDGVICRKVTVTLLTATVSLMLSTIWIKRHWIKVQNMRSDKELEKDQMKEKTEHMCKKMKKEDLLLYAVTDRHWLNGETLYSQVEKTLEGGTTFVQLREKELDEAHFLKEAKEIKELCARYRVPFVINDNVDIALEMDADGVHVGQSDMEADDVRAKLGPDKIIGVSAQTVEQAVLAEKRGADYLGVGAVFHTDSKADVAEVSRETLKAICDAVDIPVIAIGGINKENVSELAGTGICGIAVISAIFAEKDIKKATEKLKSLTGEMVKA